MNVVENIKLLSKKQNISIPKLEKELGFSKGSMYNWNKNSPSIERLQKVADYFNVSTDYLLGKEKPPGETVITSSNRYFHVPLDTKTLGIMCKIPLLNETNKTIISDMIESLLRNQG